MTSRPATLLMLLNTERLSCKVYLSKAAHDFARSVSQTLCNCSKAELRKCSRDVEVPESASIAFPFQVCRSKVPRMATKDGQLVWLKLLRKERTARLSKPRCVHQFGIGNGRRSGLSMLSAPTGPTVVCTSSQVPRAVMSAAELVFACVRLWTS